LSSNVASSLWDSYFPEMWAQIHDQKAPHEKCSYQLPRHNYSKKLHIGLLTDRLGRALCSPVTDGLGKTDAVLLLASHLVAMRYSTNVTSQLVTFGFFKLHEATHMTLGYIAI